MQFSFPKFLNLSREWLTFSHYMPDLFFLSWLLDIETHCSFSVFMYELHATNFHYDTGLHKL